MTITNLNCKVSEDYKHKLTLDKYSMSCKGRYIENPSRPALLQEAKDFTHFIIQIT